MPEEEAEKRIDALKRELIYHNYRYHVLDSPVISDALYDGLYRELEELENRYPELITPDSPTQRVGAPPLENFQTVEHALPMLSLANAAGEEEVVEFDRRLKRFLKREMEIEYAVELKLDGLAVELVYQEGRLVRGSTRGDGYRGENVTLNLRTIKTIPLKLLPPADGALPALLEVRGEVIMKKVDFARLNRQRDEAGEPPFANPRNASAGSIRQLDSSITAGRPLDIFFYGTGRMEGTALENHWDTLKKLNEFGLKTAPEAVLCRGIGPVLDRFRETSRLRRSLPFEIDGLVVKVNSFTLQEELGNISRSPRWALAVKFPPDQETTVVREIVTQVGRTGTVTPVALLEPVTVGGVEVKRATLHNQDEIDRKDIRVGDTVVIQRAGDVIPEVVTVVKEGRQGNPPPYRLPSHCPICGSGTVRSEGEAALRCPNAGCPARIEEAVKHFASRRAMDIEGLGGKLVHRLVASGLVSDAADLYYLGLDDLTGMERLAHKSAGNLLQAIGDSRRTTLPRLIYALGPRHVGEHLARVLAESFGSLEALAAASVEELTAVREIGPEVAESVHSFFKDPDAMKLLEKLDKAGVFPEMSAVFSGPLQGKSIVFTGTLSSMGRKEARDRVEKLGGKVSTTVSTGTSFLVVGENPGSKLSQARDLGVPAITEEEFLRKVG